MEIKQLDESLIEKANNNSMTGKRGLGIKHDYERYCNEVISWKLSDFKTQKLLDKVYTHYEKYLNQSANYVSVAVAGASNYNSKWDNSEKIMQTSHDFVNWFNEMKEQATFEPRLEIDELKQKIVWGIEGGYPTTKEWKKLAKLSRKEFNHLYELFNKQVNYGKASTPYKIYNDLLEIKEVKTMPIVETNDFKTYQRDEYIYIRFRMKPAKQLIVALKSRHFVYIASRFEWRAKYSDELKQWCETMNEKYRKYI